MTDIDKILDEMTLEEQVSLLSGADFWTTNAVERLGVPKIKVSDGPNGARGGGSLVGGVRANCFPCGISLGASWNVNAAYDMGAALAAEARSKGAGVLLAPTVNIDRSGLNGRNFECYSEDPELTASLAVGYVKGVQEQGVAATIKHFVGNESEHQRQTMSSDIGERALRELYLLPFERAVKEAGVWAVMSAYNRLNGTYASENEWSLKQVLRQEWVFDGIVMSDWFGSHTTVESVTAGLDLEMPGPTRDRGDKLVQAVRDGKVDAAVIEASARRILRLIERIGAFENPEIPDETTIDTPELRALLRRLASDGAVLLKNDGVLPLAPETVAKVAAIGPNAAEARIMGGGSAQINALYRVSPLDGLKAALGDTAVIHAQGCSNNRLLQEVTGDIEVAFFKGTALEGAPMAVTSSETSQFFWFDLPDEELSWDNFSVRATARFTPQKSGKHVVGLANAGFANLFIDGEKQIDGTTDWVRGDNFFGLGNNERRAEVTLEAGRAYEITVEYRPPDDTQEGIDIRAMRFGIEPVLDDTAIQEAEEAARNAEIAIVFAGRQGEWDTEGLDLPDMDLPGRQEELIARVAAANENTIVVLQTGGPVLMPWLDKVRAVLQFWYPGQELGNAVADVLFGKVEPGGRLPQTFPLKLEDNSAFTGDPITYPGVDGHVRYDEGVNVGYRHFDRSNAGTLFAFGYGLSYTTFEWSAPQLSETVIGEDGMTVAVDVTNTGERAGSEVVQLYVRPVDPKADRPLKELRAFAKLALQPGETGTATLAVTLRDLSYFSMQDKAFRADAGVYELVIARNAADVSAVARVTLEKDWIEA
ncbi:beta-glucosidase H [Martelella mangrovi]|uniref:Beta-glucosidase n=1 Tax=Martelella mangrovi TaxID=1397477 RepID=A0ABV2ID00_9HYPH